MPFTLYKQPLFSITESLLNDLVNVCNGNPPSGMSYNLFTTTDYLLNQLLLCCTGGGGGPLFNVTGTLPILVTTPAPGTRNVAFNVVRNTKAAILALQTAGTLANGGYYTITDMNAPLQEATFAAIFDNVAGKPMLQQCGNGIDAAGSDFRVAYDLATDYIFSLYHFATNQLASRMIGSANNNIENVDWGGFWRNNNILGSINNRPASFFTTVQNCNFGEDSIIDFNSINNTQMLRVNVKAIAAISVIQRVTLSDTNLEQSSTLICDKAAGVVRRTNIGTLSTLDTNGFDCEDFELGVNFQIALLQAISGETVIDGVSTVIIDLDAAANYAALALTLPGTHNYIGVFNLTNNAGGNINQIINLSLRFPTRFTCSPVIANRFQPTNVPIAVLDDITSNSPGVASIQITGYAGTSDFIVFTKQDRGGGADTNQIEYFSVNT